MKALIFILTLYLIAVVSFAQKNNTLHDSFKFSAKPDSIISESSTGYVYITTDTTAKMYKWLVPNPNNEYVINLNADYIQSIKEKFKQKIIINNIKGFPRSWNSVYLYNEKYFVYSPSDWMSNSGYYISDSVIYVTKSDPGDIFFILDYRQSGHDLSEFRVVNYSGEPELIQIKLIDSKFGIYIWTFLSQQKEIVQRYLMQDSKFVKLLPMIVCDCGQEKCLLEYQFDKTNYNRLINKK